GDLEQAEALARLKRAGTLAVTPSLGDNSPNTVYECIEHGVPLLASNDGGIPELVAPEDRSRVLFEPTPEGLAEALRRVITGNEALRPARPGFSSATSSRAWAELLELRPQRNDARPGDDPVDVIVVRRGSREGARTGTAPFVLFLDEEDVPDAELVETLLTAQARSGADAVSCGLRTAD